MDSEKEDRPVLSSAKLGFGWSPRRSTRDDIHGALIRVGSEMLMCVPVTVFLFPSFVLFVEPVFVFSS